MEETKANIEKKVEVQNGQINEKMEQIETATTKIISESKPEEQQCGVRIAVVGNVDSGKSTLVGV